MEKIVGARATVSDHQNILKMFLWKDIIEFVKKPDPATYHFGSYLN